MKVTLQYFDACPNWRLTPDRIKQVIESHNLDVELSYQLIDSPEAAKEFGFHGSPSILIDGVDPFATASTKIGFACRLYSERRGGDG